MRSVVFSLLFLVGVTSSVAWARGLSAQRTPEASYQSYIQALKLPHATPGAATAIDISAPMVNLDISNLPQWPTIADVTDAFVKIRDTRFIADPSHSGFLRRIPWLYPDDGCYARAALSQRQLAAWGYPVVAKIFAFGDLQAATPNTITGTVTWWYHEAVALRVGSQAYVFDAAVEPQKPLLLADWVNRIGGSSPAAVDVAVCAGGVYLPTDLCQNPAPTAQDSALTDTTEFLDPEWARLLELHRNPMQELGNQPPWLAGPPN